MNLDVEKWCENTNREYWFEGWDAGEMEEFAKAYTKHLIESQMEENEKECETCACHKYDGCNLRKRVLEQLLNKLEG